MRGSGWSAGVVLAVALGWACSVTAQTPAAATRGAPTASKPGTQPKVKLSPYESLPPDKLAETLEALGMRELLQGLVKQLGASGDQSVMNLEMLAKLLTSQAVGTGDIEARNKMLDDAIEMRRRIVAMMADANTPEQQLPYMHAKFKLVDAIGRLRPEPYALRLLYLRGSQEDRNAIIDQTGQGIKLLDELVGPRGEIPKLQLAVKKDLKVRVVLGPEMDDLQKTVGYYSGWIYLYRGMALPDTGKEGEERNRRLRAAIVNATPFAEGEAETGVKYWSMLLIGRARRELHEHDAADKSLDKIVDSNDAERDARVDALFEHARNLVEFGQYEAKRQGGGLAAGEPKFKEAEAALEKFRKDSRDILGEGGGVQVELKTALLANYLYETWASCQKEARKVEEYQGKAQQALLAFIIAHPEPEMQNLFFEIVGPKYRDREDFSKLDSVILLAVAGFEGTLSTPKSKQKEMDLLNEILSRPEQGEDPAIGKIVRPIAMARIGVANFQRKESEAAGGSFYKQARDYPDHPGAFNAALNAVKSYWRAIDERRARGESIPTSLRKKFVAAGELLLGKEPWRAKPEAATWYFELGWQCDEISRLHATGEELLEWGAKAVDYYAKVPTNHSEYLRALHMRLEVAVRMLSEMTDAAQRKAKAAALVDELRKYSVLARQAAGAGNTERHDELMTWGGRAAFQAAAIQYDELGQAAEALKSLERLPSEWPGTPVLRESAEFEIRGLVKQKDTKQAIAKVRDFMDKHPEEAPKLLQLVISQIRDRIKEAADKLRRDPTSTSLKADLDAYRKVYLEFAQELFSQGEKDPKTPPERLYSLRQLLGDALLESAQPQEALKQFEQAAAEESKRLEADRKGVETEYQQKVQAFESGDLTPDRLKKLYADYSEVRKKYGLAETTASADLRYAIAFLDDANSTEPMKSRVDVAVGRFQKAYDDQRDRRKQAIRLDLENIYGLARCYRGLKNYDEAEKQYTKLVRGTNAGLYPDQYWRMELEYSECILEGRRNDKKAMKALGAHVRGLRLDDETFHGLKERFDAIELEAETLSGR